MREFSRERCKVGFKIKLQDCHTEETYFDISQTEIRDMGSELISL